MALEECSFSVLLGILTIYQSFISNEKINNKGLFYLPIMSKCLVLFSKKHDFKRRK